MPGRGPRAAASPLAGLAPERALERLELHVVRRLEGLLNGEHLGLLPGPGSDLAEARPYNPGQDDVRRMDWAVTARTTIPHVRDVIADRELETWALVDLTPSMCFGTAAMEKRDLAVAAVATVGLLTYRVGDRFGGYLLSRGRLDRWPARPGRSALLALLRAVLAAGREAAAAGDAARRTPSSGAVGSSAPASAARDLGHAIDALSRAQRKRGLRVIVSDFLDPDPEASWARQLRGLALRHQVIAVEVLDPRELKMPDVGVVLLRDPETGRVREVDTGSRRTRERYAAAARAQRDRTRQALRRCGAGHLVLRTDEDWVNATARFALEQRRVAARRPRMPVEAGQ